MKSVLFLALIFTALNSSASAYFGPYLAKQIGSNTCSVKPGMVTFIENEKKRYKPVDLHANNLEASIRAAQSEPVKKSLHIAKTIPEVSIVAAVIPEIEPFDLYRDSSSLEVRQGPESKDLIKQVNFLCKGLKKPKK